ncbi:hypothetical protein E4U53_003949 [Claviceps sorghi]|nr:hypothetical protein E4U53_003949 [Claviceps sorghi]
MATEEGGPLVVDAPSKLPKSADHACGPAAETTLKRKASITCDRKVEADDTHDEEDTRSKRQRQDAGKQPSSPREPEPLPRPESAPQRRPSSQDTRQDRRESVIQEEKKRGRRLFGGLLSTLSQTSTTSHHKRRQEIEQRQQERLQRQREQDDQKRAEKLSKIREARLVEQVDFQEQVYYLPWKRTPDQEDVIEEQIRAAKSTIAHEEEEFKALKERHAIRYGLRRNSHQREDTTERTEGEKGMQQEEPGRNEAIGATEVTLVGGHSEVQKAEAQQDAHDESGDVLVDADEDMVIY